ncbi:conserved hypothetical protein [Ricinus communis]|uniref:Uncharacterized protein n=1 Tax=Ricinus communis TaxID=3988 RepID=B9T7J6_RICCO|nr:conserved hypothetical protein [Ricinus communis]
MFQEIQPNLHCTLIRVKSQLELLVQATENHGLVNDQPQSSLESYNNIIHSFSWHIPAEDYLKINFDASFAQSHKASGGIVIRNH